MKALVLALLSGCSLLFVRDLEPGPQISCTTSRVMPAADFALGAVMAGAVAAVTYGAIERVNDDCPGGCYHPWKPATLAAFLVVSPWWISSAVGFSDTSRCREAVQSSMVRR